MKGYRLIRLATFVAGLYYLVAAIGLIVTPGWFFEHVGHFPPFNRHYMGDAGSFLLPLAAGLMIASRDPVRNRPLIAVGAAASLVHMLNHLYDAVFENLMHAGWLVDFSSLVLVTTILLTVYYQSAPGKQMSPRNYAHGPRENL